MATAQISGPQEPETLSDFHPDVLILEENAFPSQDKIAYLFDEVSYIIRLSLRDSVMKVSHKSLFPSAGPQDLLDVIKGRRLAPRSRRQRQEGEPSKNSGPEVQCA